MVLFSLDISQYIASWMDSKPVCSFRRVGLKLTAFILTFRDPSSHLCEKKWMRVAVWTDLEFGSCSRIWGIFKTHVVAGIWKMRPGHLFAICNFPDVMIYPLRMSSDQVKRFGDVPSRKMRTVMRFFVVRMLKFGRTVHPPVWGLRWCHC